MEEHCSKPVEYLISESKRKEKSKDIIDSENFKN